MPPHDTLAADRSIPEAAERRWLRVGAASALAALALILLDLVLVNVPGWGTDTVPSTAAAWLDQLTDRPLLGLRNLDLINLFVAVVGLPMYLAVAWVCRRTTPFAAAFAALTGVLGTALFVVSNAALPMLQLSRQAPASGAGRLGAEGAVQALLARGAHGSFGVYPAFLVSGIGSLVTAVAMLGTIAFSRRLAWVGIVGSGLLLGYVTAVTLNPDASGLVMVLAMIGGLLMLGWNALVARRLYALSGRGLVAASGALTAVPS
ncbi:MAG TPA: DUF4386 family protein [Dermatophilaceae bacterium]|nr:DUF4386 family protein [Dermatophilaceae bacterium]